MDKNSAPKLSYTLSATIYILKASRARDEPTLIYAIFNPIPISQSGRLPIADPANGDTAECVIYAAEAMLAVPSSAAFSTKQFTVSEVFRVMNDNNTVTREFGMVMNRYDVLLAPTCAVRVPPAYGPYSLLAEEALDVWINRLVDAARYTIPANETGLPAISVPAGLDSDGLPIGVQFYGNFTGEDLLLRLAVQLEQARPEWFGIRPGVHVAA
jgi:Asp-tRNA(Asn)/Glu-tRNA(Gln) amidotransferase A subunit family amidase